MYFGDVMTRSGLPYSFSKFQPSFAGHSTGFDQRQVDIDRPRGAKLHPRLRRLEELPRDILAPLRHGKALLDQHTLNVERLDHGP